MIRGLEHPLRGKGETWNCSAWRKDGWKGIFYQHLQISKGQESSECCQTLFNNIQWQNKGQWKQARTQKVTYGQKKKYFTVRVTSHWNKLPSEVMEFLCLEILKNHMDAFLYYLLLCHISTWEQGAPHRMQHSLTSMSDRFDAGISLQGSRKWQAGFSIIEE